MVVKNAGTEPVLVRPAGRAAITIPRDMGTGAIINHGREVVSLFYPGGEFAGTLDPGEIWPKFPSEH